MYTGFYGSFVFYYRIVIGVRLLLAAVHMLFTFPAREETRSVNTLLAVVTGILPGYFSGLTGVGGEIFSVHCCCCCAGPVCVTRRYCGVYWIWFWLLPRWKWCWLR